MDIGSIMQQVGAYIASFWGIGEVQFIAGHVALNFAVALAVAITLGEFELAKFGEFLYKKLLPFVLVYIAFRALGDYSNMTALAPAVFGLIELTLITDLTDSLSKIPAFANIIPSILKKS